MCVCVSVCESACVCVSVWVWVCAVPLASRSSFSEWHWFPSECTLAKGGRVPGSGNGSNYSRPSPFVYHGARACMRARSAYLSLVIIAAAAGIAIFAAGWAGRTAICIVRPGRIQVNTPENRVIHAISSWTGDVFKAREEVFTAREEGPAPAAPGTALHSQRTW